MPPHPETTPVPSPFPTMSPAIRTKDEPSSQSQDFTVPKLRLEVRDVTHPGANLLFSSVNASEIIPKAARNVLRLLYASASDPTTTVPPTRSVTFILRDMPGVAYATGIELDDDHKEIHFSLNHISNTSKDRTGNEITGVITHELVHCLQWNGFGTCPGGLIEGIADWVRLNCDLSPPHWKKEVQEKWDAGYQHTAYFLEFLENKVGKGFVRRLNEKLRIEKYDEKKFWVELTGLTVDELFGEYIESIKENK